MIYHWKTYVHTYFVNEVTQILLSFSLLHYRIYSKGVTYKYSKILIAVMRMDVGRYKVIIFKIHKKISN